MGKIPSMSRRDARVRAYLMVDRALDVLLEGDSEDPFAERVARLLEQMYDDMTVEEREDMHSAAEVLQEFLAGFDKDLN